MKVDNDDVDKTIRKENERSITQSDNSDDEMFDALPLNSNEKQDTQCFTTNYLPQKTNYIPLSVVQQQFGLFKDIKCKPSGGSQISTGDL